MAEPIIQTSFAGGELSPSLYARVDLEKFHVGLSLSSNFFIDFRGGATTRPGTEFCAEANTTAGKKRLVPFQVSVGQSFALEFGELYVRFYTGGAQLLKPGVAITGISQANPGVVTAPAHGFVNGNEVHISGVGGMVNLNGRNFGVAGVTVNTFQLHDIHGNLINTSVYPAYTAGGTVAAVYQLTTPYHVADLPLLKYVQSADVITLTHPLYPPADLRQLTPNTFSYTVNTIGETIQPPTALAATPSTAGNNNYGYCVTALSQDGTEESIASAPAVADSVILDHTNNKVVKLAWTPPVGQIVAGYNIYKWGPVPDTDPVSTIYGYIGQTKSNSFTDANIAADFSKVPPQFSDPFSIGQVLAVNPTAAGAGYAGHFVPLTFTGPGTGAAGYAVVDPSTGGVVAAVITKTGTGYSSCVVHDTGANTAVYAVNLGAISGTYPGCVSYIQQRRVYAAPTNSPETMDLSQTGHYANFDTTPTSQDTDAIGISLASREVNAIQSMVPMSTGLITFTTGGAVLVTGGGIGQPITPGSITAAWQASLGANNLPPIVVNYNVLYVQNRGTNVRDLAFNFYVQSYYGYDRSTLANHLFYNHTIIDWAMQQEPNKIVWCIRDDGVLLSFTYVPEQEVYAWARHETNGVYESVCSVAEGNLDAVYFIVRRFVNGQWVRYVERLADGIFDYVWDAWCVDAGLQYPLASPDTTIYPGALTGAGVAFSTDANVFAPGDVGKVIWLSGGNATITGYASPTVVTATIGLPLLKAFPDGTPTPQNSGTWSYGAPVTVLEDLDHLEGKSIVGLADGSVVGPLTVVGGKVTLATPASKIIIGLGYTCNLKTLRVNVGGNTTDQGQLKFLPDVTIRMYKALGLSCGSDFTSLQEFEDTAVPFSAPTPLFEGDLRMNIYSDWDQDGYICVQQAFPLPATVLGIIPEVVPGDTTN